MSKTIRVSDEVYDRIQALQAPRETLSQVIDRCLSTVEAIRTLPIREWPGVRQQHERDDQEDAIRKASLERAALERRRLKEEV